jgi:hypothetical protein
LGRLLSSSRLDGLVEAARVRLGRFRGLARCFDDLEVLVVDRS